MLAPAIPVDEQDRLDELWDLGLLDTDHEERFDRLVRLARHLFDVPIAALSLVDADRQWFKSVQGINLRETSRDVSFCGHVVAGDGILSVPDAAADERFADNPLVVGEPSIRFYAGCPILGPTGLPIGSFCIMDRVPRQLDEADLRVLADLAATVEREVVTTRLATVDDLTGLTNRRGYQLINAKLMALCRRQYLPATLLYVDLDRFHAINDEFGRAAGDRALQEFAAILESTFRASDVVARLGADEFAVLMAGVADGTAAQARLEEALAERNATTTLPYRLEASTGATTFDPLGGEPLGDVANRAEMAIFASKVCRGLPQSAF